MSPMINPDFGTFVSDEKNASEIVLKRWINIITYARELIISARRIIPDSRGMKIAHKILLRIFICFCIIYILFIIFPYVEQLSISSGTRSVSRWLLLMAIFNEPEKSEFPKKHGKPGSGVQGWYWRKYSWGSRGQISDPTTGTSGGPDPGSHFSACSGAAGSVRTCRGVHYWAYWIHWSPRRDLTDMAPAE